MKRVSTSAVDNTIRSPRQFPLRKKRVVEIGSKVMGGMGVGETLLGKSPFISVGGSGGQMDGG